MEQDESLIPLLRYAESLGIKFQRNDRDDIEKEVTWRAHYPEDVECRGWLLTKYIQFLDRFEEEGKCFIIDVALSKDGKTIKPEPGDERIYFLVHEIGHIENANVGLLGLPDCPDRIQNNPCAKSEILASVRGINILIKLGYLARSPALDSILENWVEREARRCPNCLSNPACQAELRELSLIKMDALVVKINVEELLKRIPLLQ